MQAIGSLCTALRTLSQNVGGNPTVEDWKRAKSLVYKIVVLGGVPSDLGVSLRQLGLTKKGKPWKVEKARAMRKQQTEAETALWARLRRKALGVRVHRQRVMIGYILDFYIPKWRLAVEIDGPSHNTDDRRLYDRQRTGHLEAKRIRVIRFTNKEVLTNLDRVVQRIIQARTL